MRKESYLKLVIFCLLCLSVICCGSDAWCGPGVVTGRVQLKDGTPLSHGEIYFFEADSQIERPVVGKFWKVPGAIEKLDGSGSFSAELDEGTYYVAAIKRTVKDRLGPPQDGDLFLPSHDKKGVYRTVTVRADATSDIGTIKGAERYYKKNFRYKGKLTAMEGKIVTTEGAPVKGMYVFAYTDESMRGRPLFVSEQSAKDGRFFLPVDTGRTFFLKTRDIYAGGTPKAGALVGVLGDAENPTPVVTKPDAITRGIVIQVYPFRGQGKQPGDGNN
jgi:hypothetical protein